jgi:hypothetical protein
VTIAPDAKAGGFTDAANGQGERVAPEDMQRQRRITIGGHKFTAKQYDRRTGSRRQTARCAGVRTGKFGDYTTSLRTAALIFSFGCCIRRTHCTDPSRFSTEM